MKRIKIVTVLLFFPFVSATVKAQNCTDCRYLAPVFDSVKVTSNYHFGQGVNADGDTQQLYLDIYEPFGDTATNRPVLVFAFGGGFVQGEKTDWYVVEICKHFSRAGYVCASIDYRTGIVANEIISLQYMRIFFRPMQDMRASVQFLKAQFAEMGNPHRIDTSRIVIGGASAGGITALMTAHCDKSSEIAEMGNLSALNALGGFNSTSGFYPNYSWNSIGTVNISGALINADWVEPGDKPIISAHGNADQIVPYGNGYLGGISVAGFNMLGSYLVDSVARAKGVCSYLYTMEGQDHPSEEMGMPYIYGVVYRITQRMYALITDKSFCCPLSVDITPGDTILKGASTFNEQLTAQIANDNGNAQLQWCSMACTFSSNANTVNVAVEPSLEFISLTATEGNCLAADIHTILDSSLVNGLSDVNSENTMLDVYPQPANRQLTVSFETKKAGKFSIRITDLTGKTVLSQNLESNKGKKQQNIDIQKLDSGTYLLEALSENKSIARKKIVVVR